SPDSSPILGSAGSSSGDGDGGFQGCATGAAGASRQPVYLLFVLDGSGSMNHDSKWIAATGAIDTLFEDMQAKGDHGIGAGLIVYSDSDDPAIASGGAYPTSVDVPIAFVDPAQLDKLKKRTAPPDSPNSNTPTGRALTGAYNELAKFQPPAPLE